VHRLLPRAALLAVILAVCAFSQTAQLTGVVTDTSGAVVPGAKVTATNIDTGVAGDSTSNDSGNYLITALLPGRYQVTAEKTGFKLMKLGPITLAVDQVGGLNFTMEVGAAQETVTVEASSVLLDTATATVANMVENKQVLELPLNGRSPMDLVALSPGIRVQGSFGGRLVMGGTPGGAWMDFSFNGGIAGGNAVLVEGLALEMAQMNAPSYIPPPDATQEFRVASNPFSAENNRTTGAVVNFSIKSGTNQLHGSAYEFWRNRDLNANDFFQNRAGNPRAPFNQNQFGGSVGGPIKKDKTFFFANYEEYRRRIGAPAITTVPTAAQVSGNFSQTYNASGAMVVVADPFSNVVVNGVTTHTPFPGNVIPTSRISTVAGNVAKFFPAATLPGTAFTDVNNYSNKAATFINEHQFVTKLDHNLSSRWKIFGAIGRDWLNQTQADPLGMTPNETRVVFNDHQVYTLSATAVFSPTLIADLHTGFARVIVNSVPAALGYNITQLGFPASLASQTQIQSLPGFQVSGLTAIGGSSSAGISLGAHNSWDQRGALTKVMGSHTLKVGGDWRVQQMNQELFNTNEPLFNFTNQFTAINPLSLNTASGVPMASFLLGDVSSASVAKGQRMADERRYMAVYFQDDWKVSPKLTVNMGTDYSLEFPITDRYNRKMWFDNTALDPAGSVVGFPIIGGFQFASSSERAPTNLYPKQIGPRFGVAYQALKNTVIRSGFGIFWIPASLSEVTGDTRAPAFDLNTPMTTTLNGGVTPYYTLDNPYPQGIANPPGSSQGLNSLIGQDAATNWRNMHTGYMGQWNFDIQQNLRREGVLEVTYSGSTGVGLPAGWATQINQVPDQYLSLGSQLNQVVANPYASIVSYGPMSQPTILYSQLLRPYPQFTTLFGEGQNVGHSSYHGLEVQYRQRFAGGIVTAAYTFSKSIGNTENRSDFQELSNSALGSDGFEDWYNRSLNRAVSIEDVPNRFVLSYSYVLPFGPGQRLATAHNFASRFISGWEVNGIYTAQNGVPISPYNATNTTGNYTSVSDVYGTFDSNSFPDTNGQNAVLSGPRESRLNEWFNVADFSQPAPFTYGNAGRTIPAVRGDGANNLDFSVFKNNTFGHEGRFNLQIRGEFFNVANHVRFGMPGLAYGNSTFGVISSAWNTPRQIQLAMKLLF